MGNVVDLSEVLRGVVAPVQAVRMYEWNGYASPPAIRIRARCRRVLD